MENTIYEWDETARKDCIANGIEYNEISDKEAWLEAMQPLYDTWAQKDPLIADFIETVKEIDESMN